MGAVDDNRAMLVTSQKRSLRREIRAARWAGSGGRDRDADADALAAALAPLWRGGRIRCVAAYEALVTEPPTDAVVRAAQADGCEVILPRLLADRDLDWVRRGLAASAGTLGRGGISLAGVVLVPALAVDRQGVRLGQGGGSYDRALPRRAPGSLVVAVVNDEEYVEHPLPREPHDALVDAVVTPGRGLLRLG